MALTKINRGGFNTGISDSSDANAITIDSSEKVGIGTGSPDNKVNILESVLSGRSASNTNTSLTIEHATDTGIQFFSATQTQLRFGDAAGTGAGSIIYEHSTDKLRLTTSEIISFEDNGVARMTIINNGNIGIGTTSPSSNGGGTAKVLHVHSPNANAWAVTKYTNTTSGTGSGDGTIVGHVDSDAYLFNYESGNIFLGTSGDTKMTIKPDGNVGIGTTNPDKTLTVRGTSGDIVQAKIIYAGSDGNRSGLILQNTHTGGREYGLYVGNNSTGAGLGNSFGVMDNTASAYRLIINSNGNVGIGTTSIPSANSAYLTVGTQDYAISHNGFSKNSYFNGSSYTAVTNSAGKLIQMGDDIVFYHAPTVAAGAAQTLDEVMSIKSATSEPILNVTGAGYGYTHGAMALKSDTGYDARVRGQGIFLFNEENDTTWYAGTPYLNTAAGNRPFDFNFQSGTTSLSAATATGTGTYTAARIHASGVISTPAGIELGSGVDATAANTLDDYEEGSFNPVLSWYTPSNGSVSYTARTAEYVKVGKAVTIHLEMRLNIVSQNSATLPLLVSGFPFPFRNTGGYGGCLMQVSLQGFTFSSGHIPFGWGEYNSDRMFLFTMSSNAANNNLATPPNYKTINVSGTYITTT